MRSMSIVAGLLLAFAACAHAQSGGGFVNGYPTPEFAQRAQNEADFQRAVVAYRFWYPAVSAEGIFNGNRIAGMKDNEAMGITSTGPRQVGFTLNSDTPYGSAILDLRNGPMVIELPSGPFIGLVNDHYQSWILDIGLPGPDAGKGGKHVILPPGYTGAVPTDHQVGRSSSYKVLVAARSMPVGGDVDKALAALRTIRIHPLNGDKTLAFIDTTKTAMDSTSLRWEDNFQFWQVLAKIVDEEPVNEAWLPFYGELAALGILKGKPFQPDARLKGILERAAKAGRDQMLVSAFASTRPDRQAWPDRKWEWVGLVAENGDFRTPGGYDLEARDRWFAQAIVTSPAMFRRNAGAGSLYWLGVRDSGGAYLDGGKSYRLVIPQPVPGKLFWSVTVYDAQTRSQVQTDQDKAALRSLFELKDAGGSAPVTLHFGPTSPAGSDAARWIKTAPGRGWFAYIRIYGPEGAAFDGTWKPGDFEPVP
ncbi:MAG: DUF1254 domain-containing protein [Reyranella sp.]|uniref:DUF1254 domain-containing protein n=1 Tax=Reyranella sp. TaxID=1929291 RepID=UPI001ACC2A95|nr:DUF1254 domain-containing protein [Reyranella sp.]MBN9085306.1 DUF1254 domain-containing protein [Reyranella sp.]